MDHVVGGADSVSEQRVDSMDAAELLVLRLNIEDGGKRWAVGWGDEPVSVFERWGIGGAGERGGIDLKVEDGDTRLGFVSRGGVSGTADGA